MSNCKARNLNGQTDSEILNLTIQQSLMLESNGDLQSWNLYEDKTSSSFKFDRATPSGDTTALEIDTSGNATFSGLATFSSGFGLLGNLDMNDNDLLNVDSITGNSVTGLLGIDDSVNLTTTNDYQINSVSVLDSTSLGSGVVNSSLTSVGTLTSLDVAGNLGIRDNDEIQLSTDNLDFIRSNGTDIELYVNGGLNTTFTNSGKNISCQGAIIADNINGTTLGSTVINSSLTANTGNLTNTGTLNLTTTNDYQINSVSVLDSTSLGSGVINSSLTSNTGNLTNTGTLNVTTGNDYKINSTSVLSSTTLGSGIVNSSIDTNSGNLQNNGTFTINSDTQAKLIVKTASNTGGGNSYVEIRGGRDGVTGARTANLDFSNYDNDLSATNKFGSISGLIRNSTTNIGDMIFYRYPDGASPNEAIRIESTGDIGIHLSNPTHTFELGDDDAAKTTTTTWTTTSDRKYKENIISADYQQCIDNIKAIDLKYYKWKDDFVEKKKVKDIHMLGFIAQDIQSIFPNSVEYNDIKNEEGIIEDNYLSLNADQINKTMFGAIKYLIEKVEALESKNKK